MKFSKEVEDCKMGAHLNVPKEVWVVLGENGVVWGTFLSDGDAKKYCGPRGLELCPRTVAKYVIAEYTFTQKESQ